MVVFCEGVTETEYISALNSLPSVKSHTHITISAERLKPLPMVQRCETELVSEAADEYWCVFDVEWPRQHPKLREALALARRTGIRVAVSNPCFELWLILHFQEHDAHLSTDEAVAIRQGHDGRTGKHIDPGPYMASRATATRRARTLEAKHRRDDSSMPHDNPSSSVYQLLESLESPPAQDDGA